MDSISQRKVWFCDPPRGMIGRSLALRDLEKIKSIADASFPKKWSNSDFSYFLTSESGRCFGLEEEKEIVGYALTLLAQGDLDIVSIATHPSYRRKGIASWLLGRVNHMKDVKRVYLEVESENTPAIELYKKCGFETYGIRKKYYEGQRDAVLMRRSLRPLE